MAITGSRVLLDGIRRNRRWLTAGSAMYGGHQICEALVPVVIGVIIDRAVATGDVGELVRWLAVLAVLFVVLSLMWRFGARLLTYAEAGEGCTLRVEVAGKILQPRGIRTELRSGELLTISSSDADNASYLLDYIPRIVASLTATAVCAVTLLLINVPLGLAVVLGTPLVLVVLQLSAPLITRRIQHQQETAGEAASVATDLVAGLRPLRGIGAQDAATQRYRDVSGRSLRATLRAARTQRGFEGVSATISNLLAAGIAIAAGWLALDGAEHRAVRHGDRARPVPRRAARAADRRAQLGRRGQGVGQPRRAGAVRACARAGGGTVPRRRAARPRHHRPAPREHRRPRPLGAGR